MENDRTPIKSIPPEKRIFTVPNLVTVSGFFFTALIVVFWKNSSLWWAFSMYVIAAVTDADGSLAKWGDKRHPILGKSELGATLDPVRDRALLIAFFWVDPAYALLAASIEAVTLYFSLTVRGEMKRLTGDRHYVAPLSKLATVLQFLGGGLVYLFAANGTSWRIGEGFEVVVLASSIRLVAYFIKWLIPSERWSEVIEFRRKKEEEEREKTIVVPV